MHPVTPNTLVEDVLPLLFGGAAVPLFDSIEECVEEAWRANIWTI